MKDYWIEPSKKKINKKKIVISVVITVIIAILIVIGVIYTKDINIRNWIDKNIFRKEISQNMLPTVDIDERESSEICAFNKYIGVLSKNIFSIYNNTGKKENELKIEITKPIFDSNSRHLAIAEEKGKKIYLITDKNIRWEKDIEGNISQVEVNKNGYVAVTIVDTSYKTVIALYDNEGKELFNTYLSTTRVIATTISNDNKYLAFAEIDTSGTIIQSNVKIISIEEGKNNPENSIKQVYNGENNELITNIKYQDKGNLICMYTDKITEIKTDSTVEDLEKDKKMTFASIELSDGIVSIEEKSTGLFKANSEVNIIHTSTKERNVYNTEAVAKEIYTSNNNIALNLGSEIEIIDTKGWLIKKYLANQEINNIVLADSIVRIIYRDKIEIISI